jgi:phospholipid transport system transporter-binding protein
MQLPATATLDEAAALAEALPGNIAAGSGPLSIDAAALQTFDTSVIALLLQARRLAAEAGRGFQVTGAPAKLAQLAQLYGVEELLSLAPAAAGPGPA